MTHYDRLARNSWVSCHSSCLPYNTYNFHNRTNWDITGIKNIALCFLTRVSYFHSVLYIQYLPYCFPKAFMGNILKADRYYHHSYVDNRQWIPLKYKWGEPNPNFSFITMYKLFILCWHIFPCHAVKWRKWMWVTNWLGKSVIIIKWRQLWSEG